MILDIIGIDHFSIISNLLFKVKDKKCSIGINFIFSFTKSLVIVDDIFYNQTDPENILKEVGKRTVYSKKEIENMAKTPLLVVLFIHSFH